MRKFLILSIAILMALSMSFSYKTPEASAGLSSGSVVVVSNNIVDDLKEWVLDNAAFVFTKTMIRGLTDSIVNWINSGFEGDPIFVSNPRDYLLDIANETTGVFLSETGRANWCEPFRPHILIALSQVDTYMERAECTLLDVVDNIEDFYEDFSEGGWRGWIELTQNPQNNPYGAYLIAETELSRRLAKAELLAQKEVDQGAGFVSLKKCVEYDTDISLSGENCTYRNGICIPNEEPNCIRYENTTPGRIIADHLSFNLGSSQRQLELADELGESIAAIGNALINQLITSGLRSLTSTQGGSATGTWYYDEIEAGKEDLENLIEKDLEKEYERMAVSEGIESTGQLIRNIKSCYLSQINIISNPEFKPPTDAAVPSIDSIRKKINDLEEKEETLNSFEETFREESDTANFMRWFEWGTKARSLRENTVETPHGETASNFSETITGLTPNTTYYFRAVGESPDITIYGNILSFTTTENQSSVIATKPPSNITDGSAILNGFADSQGDVNAKTWFNWGTNPDTLWNSTDEINTDGASLDFNEIINELDTDIAYYFRAAIRTSTGTQYGNTLGFIISPGSEYSAVTTNAPTSITKTSSLLNGYINPADTTAIRYLQLLLEKVENVKTPGELTEAWEEYNEYKGEGDQRQEAQEDEDINRAKKEKLKLLKEKDECWEEEERLGGLHRTPDTTVTCSGSSGENSSSSCSVESGGSSPVGSSGGSGDDEGSGGSAADHSSYSGYSPSQCLALSDTASRDCMGKIVDEKYGWSEISRVRRCQWAISNETKWICGYGGPRNVSDCLAQVYSDTNYFCNSQMATTNSCLQLAASVGKPNDKVCYAP